MKSVFQSLFQNINPNNMLKFNLGELKRSLFSFVLSLLFVEKLLFFFSGNEYIV